jgi:type VI secretion system protein ImpA
VRVNARWDGHGLLDPISEAEPCGKNLEYSEALGAFDLFQIFGQSSLEHDPQEPRKNRPPNWGEIRDLALETLKTSKDLRLLAHLGSALLRTDGVPAFAQTLDVASQWLERHWDQVYPLVDEDAIFRRNALNCFADPVAVVDGLRRIPLVSSRQHGRFSLRDLEVATGQLAAGQSEEKADETQIRAAFSATPLDELKGLSDSVSQALSALSSIDGIMRRHAGVEAAPTIDPLSSQLKKMDVVLRAQLAVHPDAGGAADAVAGETSAQGNGSEATIAVGSIKSRQDAIRALEAAAEFFRRNEPSSPVPLFVDRAKRLIAKDFLEVLADVAPDALPQARSAGGLKDE